MKKSEEIIDKLVRISYKAESLFKITKHLTTLKKAYTNVMDSISNDEWLTNEEKRDIKAWVYVSDVYDGCLGQAISNAFENIVAQKNLMDKLYEDTQKCVEDMSEGKSWGELWNYNEELARKTMSVDATLRNIRFGQDRLNEMVNELSNTINDNNNG